MIEWFCVFGHCTCWSQQQQQKNHYWQDIKYIRCIKWKTMRPPISIMHFCSLTQQKIPCCWCSIRWFMYASASPGIFDLFFSSLSLSRSAFSPVFKSKRISFSNHFIFHKVNRCSSTSSMLLYKTVSNNITAHLSGNHSRLFIQTICRSVAQKKGEHRAPSTAKIISKLNEQWSKWHACFGTHQQTHWNWLWRLRCLKTRRIINWCNNLFWMCNEQTHTHTNTPNENAYWTHVCENLLHLVELM